MNEDLEASGSGLETKNGLEVDQLEENSNKMSKQTKDDLEGKIEQDDNQQTSLMEPNQDLKGSKRNFRTSRSLDGAFVQISTHSSMIFICQI
jgi:hypothetical protein